MPLFSGVAAAGDGRGGLRERVPRAARFQPLHGHRGRREGCEGGHQDRVHVQLIRGRGDIAVCGRELSGDREWPILQESPDFITDHYV